MLLCCRLQYDGALLQRAEAASLPARREKAERIRSVQGRAASLAAGLLLRHGLFLCGLGEDQIRASPEGKPVSCWEPGLRQPVPQRRLCRLCNCSGSGGGGYPADCAGQRAGSPAFLHRRRACLAGTAAGPAARGHRALDPEGKLSQSVRRADRSGIRGRISDRDRRRSSRARRVAFFY